MPQGTDTSPDSHDSRLDDPGTTVSRKELLRTKRILRVFYADCYAFFQHTADTAPPGRHVELGSGAGFLKETLPGVVTTECLPVPDVDCHCSALALPFRPASLSALLLLDVFHHIPDADAFLREADRCLCPGGVLVMVEPANTLFSRFIYTRFHHEAFDPQVEAWTLPDGGPLSTANGALPWIVFRRDEERFARLYPHFHVEVFEAFGPIRYLVSGGMSHPQFLPGWCSPLVGVAEWLLRPLNPLCGMFVRIVVRKADH